MTVVESYCSMIAGPSIRSSGAQPLAVVEGRQPPLGTAADIEDDLALDGLRHGRVAVPLLRLRPPQLLDLADADDADIDDLDLGLETVAVLPLVRLVERVRKASDPGLVDRAGGDVEANFVALACVAAIGQATNETAALRNAVGLELREGLGRQLVETGRQPVAVERLQRVPLRGDVLVLEVGREQAGRRGDSRVRRDEHARDLQLECDVAGEERAGAAGRHEREFARVVAAPDAVQLDRLRHPELLDLERAERGLFDADAERAGDLLHRLARELCVELHAAAEEPPVRAQAAEHELGVGRGGLHTAAAVAGGAGIGARRLRTDAEDAARVHVGDRAPAGADRVDVDHRHHRLVVADLRVQQMPHPQLAAGCDADVCRRAAHVERDDVLEAGHPTGPDAADQAGDGPRHQEVHRPLRRRLDRRHPAGGLHQLHLALVAGRAQRLVEAGDVTRNLRPDVRVQTDGREALELAVERQHLVRDRKKRLGELFEHDLLDPPFVLGLEV